MALQYPMCRSKARHRLRGRSRSHGLAFARDYLHRKDFNRADLIFQDVDHAGPSYEARVYLNNPNATADTAATPEDGYAGSFHTSATALAWASQATAR